MRQNVGSMEQMVRYAVGAAAGAAALRARGWRQAALCSIATGAFFTAMTRTSPLKGLLGVRSGRLMEAEESDLHDQGVRDAGIRRETQTSGATGRLPGSI